MWVILLEKFALQFVLDILYYPLWWYTGGAQRMILFCWRQIKEGNLNFSPGLWLANIFVPMFGQYDWQGRIVSFFMRLVNVIFRFFALLIWVIIVVGIFFVYLLLPVFIAYLIFAPYFVHKTL
ncbi:MAG TPA: hypothetical protein PLV72_00025 [Candidatus Magasanikbacteria bacterium]|nr:hypothetical protein [Candidatus Magasanikbacteria bacterium]